MSRVYLGLFLSILGQASAVIGFAAPVGISRVDVSQLGDRDKTRIDFDRVFVQLAWALHNYPKLSKFQVSEAKANTLTFMFQGRRRVLPVVELRHAKVSDQRRLMVMSSGLFASEWDDLELAKWFYDQGYDVLKLPTALSESYVRAFPLVLPGDLNIEAEILTLTVMAYRVKYGIEAQGHEVVAFGASYGASILLKTAERFPNFFSRIAVTAPIYDFAYALQIMDEVMGLVSTEPAALGDADKGVKFLMAADPQALTDEGFETFAKVKVAEFMLKKIRLYCWIRSKPADQESCTQLMSFAEMLRHLDLKTPTGRLKPTINPRVNVLTTANDPLNRTVMAIGRTVELEKGGHSGFLGTDVERKFIVDSLKLN